MKISEAALLLLILAAALGPPTHGLPSHGLERYGDCCYSYAPLDIRCAVIADYYVTGKLCSKSAVIFITKRKQAICADPHRPSVKRCTEALDSAKERGDKSAEEKPQ